MHLHIKKAENKVVDLQQSACIRVLLRGEPMRHFAVRTALTPCLSPYLKLISSWVWERKVHYTQKD